MKRAVEAWTASAEAIQSGSAVVAFESYAQEPQDTEPRLWSKGRAEVYFDGSKNHIHFTYETKLGKVRQIGQAEDQIVERKPKDLVVIDDGTMVREIIFQQRSCRIEIYSSLDDVSLEVQGDPTRLWLSQVDPPKLLEAARRGAVEVTGLGGGAWRFRYTPFANSKERFEIEVSPEAGSHPTRFRIVNPDLEKPALDHSAKWTKSGGVWHIDELVMNDRYRLPDKPGLKLHRSVFRYQSFKPGAKVDAKLFTLDCLDLPPRTRTFDRRRPEKR